MGTYLGAALRGPLMSILRHHEGLTQLRRDLHANPELGFEEHRTGALVAEKLRSFGVDEVHTGIARTGVVGLIRGRGNGGRAIGLRADMDALPILEEDEFAHRSTRSGLMHGCGHDGHTTIRRAAQYLAATRRFDGNAVPIFSPAKKAMPVPGHDRRRLFDRFPVDESMHCQQAALDLAISG
jgi:hippurate hydrolase